MAVKVFIKRFVPRDKEEELNSLLQQLRSATLEQPGYLSGQTFKRTDRDGEYMVVGTWRSAEDWHNWFNNDKRKNIQNKIDQLLGTQTEYGVYE